MGADARSARTPDGRRALAAALALAALVAVGGGTAAAKKEDPREQTAREFYASGKYREAIAVFAQLYATSPHPNYLFNIGRCYQNLPDPDHAIISFKDYLRKSPKLSADERKEIDGYIQEMADLKKGRGAAESALSELGAKEDAPVAVRAAASAPAAASVATATAPSVPSTGVGGAAGATNSATAGTTGAAPTPAAAPATAAASTGKPAAADHPSVHPMDPPMDPGSVQLASWHARGEALWKEQSARADDAKLAQVEGLLAKAKPEDPRRAEYALFLGRLYAAKHFRTRLKASESRKLDTTGAPADERKALDADASASFLKSVSSYLEASKAKSFPRADEALYQLAMILDANNMEARAAVVLNRLVRTMPDSRLARQVAAGASASTPAQ